MSAPTRPKVDGQLAGKLEALQCCFVLADCREPDLPITFASSGFYELTGYSPDQVLGKNCRFLQGPETSRQKVCLINYKRSGDKFWNQFYLAPVLDEINCVSHYMGIQSDVTKLMSHLGTHELEGTQVEADIVDSPSIGHQTCFPDVVSEEQQKAQGVHSVLTSWSSSDGRHSGDMLRWSTGPSGVPAQDLPSSLLAPLMRLQKSFVLSDPRLHDCPIVHASTAFLLMTGYPRDAVVGRNCRFLQGPQTDKVEVQRMRDAITAEPPQPITVRLLNYRIDGQPFWNNLHVAPIRSASGEVVFFVGVQLDITAPSTPRAAPSTQQQSQSRFAPMVDSADADRQLAATAHPQESDTAQQPTMLPSSAASLQAQSQASQHSHTSPQHQDPAESSVQSDSHSSQQLSVPHSAEANYGPQQAGHRQLLTRQSAPAGSLAAAAAARAVLLPDQFLHRLHVHPAAAHHHTPLGDLPECGQATIQHRIDQKSVVGAVRVACRSLCPQGLRRSQEEQASPRHQHMLQIGPVSCSERRRSFHMRQTM
ncbi:TPA: hypothetical protein ACH3X1_004819 [Trebouxia sp. C0004]